MDKIVLIVAILTYSIFAADTLYLKDGKEIKDASIIEIGVSDVKYKVGKKEVLYTVRKSDIAIIFYSDGTKEVFAESKNDNAVTGQGGVQIVQNVQNTVTPTNNIQNSMASTSNTESIGRYENFTTGQRWGTWALNALTISGLGSWLIMGDVAGGFVHLGLDVAAIAFLVNAETSDEEYVCSGGYYDSYNSYCGYESTYTTSSTMITLGAVFYITGAIWNIYRSASYDKPKNVAYSKYGNFNMAVLPNKHGDFNAYLMYNKVF
jgi:hypothetical protein